MPAPQLAASDTLADLIRSAKQASIDAATASITLVAAKASKRGVILHVYLESEGTGSVQFKSDSTNLTGPFDMADEDVLELKNNGVPVLIGHDLNKALTLANPGTVQINGMVIYTYLDTK